MRKRILPGVFVLAYLTIITSVPAATTPAVPDLSGTWLIDSLPRLGLGGLFGSRLTLTRNSFALTGYYEHKNPWTGTFTLGANGNPANLDFHSDPYEMSGTGMPDEVYPPSSLRGIYKLEPTPDGDRLTICLANHGNSPRPTEFQTTDDARLAVFVRTEPDFKSFPADVTITVLDPGGHPAAGASIFNYMDRSHSGKLSDNHEYFILDLKSPMTWSYIEVAKTGLDGTVRLPYKSFENGVGPPAGAHDPSHHWIGFADTSPAALRHGILTIRMQPERMVRGTITSDALTKAGKPVLGLMAYVYSCDNRIIFSNIEGGALELPIPPGQYTLDAYGSELQQKWKQFTVPTGTGDFSLPPISLEPSQIVSLYGQPAPPLRDVLAWKNAPVDLTALKGKVVLLTFWGYWCGPCVREMPTLMRLYDKYKDRGLAIVSVHVDVLGDTDTAAKLDQKTTVFRNGIWKGRDIPFPTALVSGTSGNTDDCHAVKDYGITHYPSTITIARDGKLSRDGVSFFEDDKSIDAEIERLLAK